MQRAAQLTERYNAALDAADSASAELASYEAQIAAGKDLPERDLSLLQMGRSASWENLRKAGLKLKGVSAEVEALETMEGRQSAGQTYATKLRFLYEESLSCTAPEMEPAALESVRTRLAAAVRETEMAVTNSYAIKDNARATAVDIDTTVSNERNLRWPLPPRLSGQRTAGEIPEWAADPPLFPRSQVGSALPRMPSTPPPPPAAPATGAPPRGRFIELIGRLGKLIGHDLEG